MAINASISLQGKPRPSVAIRTYAAECGVWNGENESGNCTRNEAALMIQRATGKDPVWSGSNPDQFVSRGEVAEILANTFA